MVYVGNELYFYTQMKRKKFVPQSQQYQDYLIFELAADIDDYRMAFELNKLPWLHLERYDDLPVYAGGKTNPERYSLYYSSSDIVTAYLLQNTDDGFALMKSYFLIIEGHAGEEEQQLLNDHCTRSAGILSINTIDTSDTKSKNFRLITAILTDLEYHMLEIKKQSEEQKVKLKASSKQTIKKLYDR